VAEFVAENKKALENQGLNLFVGGPDGPYDNLGQFGHWWTSTEYNAELSLFMGMSSSSSNVSKGTTYKRVGFSVCCIKD